MTSQLSGFYSLFHLSIGGNNGDDGGGNIDGLQTSRMKVLHSSHSTDTVDNTHTDYIRIRSPGSHSRSTPAQIRFRTTLQRQNAVPKQKRIRLPPIQLREVVSSSYFTSQSIKQLVRRKVVGLFGRYSAGVSRNTDILADSSVRDTI